jgi:hypothetical protein
MDSNFWFLVAKGQTVIGDGTAVSKTGADLLGNRRFESISLQRRVRTKRTHRRTISAGNAVPTGDRWFESISLQRKVCELSVRLLSRPEGDVRGIGFQTVRTYIAIGNSEAVAKCPSPRPSPRIPGRTGERAYETRLGITGRLAARGGRGRIGAPILNALLPIFANLRPFVRAPHAARPHMLLGVSRKRAMGCRGHEIAQGASRP